MWAVVERHRLALGWSARKLSREAHQGRKGSESHYSVIANRDNWNADLATVNKFVEALVRAGVPREEFGAAPAGRPVPEAEVTLLMAREAAELLAAGLGQDVEDVWPDFLHPFEKSKADRWTVSAMVREVGKLTRQRLGLDGGARFEKGANASFKETDLGPTQVPPEGNVGGGKRTRPVGVGSRARKGPR